jgi:hypothetical protein
VAGGRDLAKAHLRDWTHRGPRPSRGGRRSCTSICEGGERARERERSGGKKKKEYWISALSLFVWVVVILFDFWLFSNGSTGEWESREHEREMREEEKEGRQLGIVRGERRETVFFLDYNNLLGSYSASQGYLSKIG